MSNSTLLSDSKLTELMHRAGIRPSVQRIAVLSFIANMKSHPTADDIYCELAPKYPSLSRTTVYNSLHALAESGLVRELEIESGIKHYDFAMHSPHSHFICHNCGRIYDMDIPAGLENAAMPGFSVDSIDVYIKGTCPVCKTN